MSESETYECPECGNEREWNGEREVCHGTAEYGRHSKRTVVKPCGICGDPITAFEMCDQCAEKSDVDAVTPTWGSHRYE